MDAQTATFGLTIGETYQMDIFHAERRNTGSNFQIETIHRLFLRGQRAAS